MSSISSSQGFNKLSPDDVCEVPMLLREGASVSFIARRFSVTPAAIRNVIREERWKRYSDEAPGHPDRCPDCGGMVVDDMQPCHYCEQVRLRSMQNVPSLFS